MVRSRGNCVLGREREGVENKKEAKKKTRQILNCTQSTGKGTDPAWAEKGVVRKSKRKSQRANRIKSLGNQTYRRASRRFSKYK